MHMPACLVHRHPGLPGARGAQRQQKNKDDTILSLQSLSLNQLKQKKLAISISIKKGVFSIDRWHSFSTHLLQSIQDSFAMLLPISHSSHTLHLLFISMDIQL